jgi:hypothetical protein
MTRDLSLDLEGVTLVSSDMTSGDRVVPNFPGRLRLSMAGRERRLALPAD